MTTHFSKEEIARYSRHLLIPDFNIEGQRKLKQAKVLVIGAGGLGSPLLLYLAAAGVGTIGIVDFDTIDESNLQRQVLFDSQSVGKLKAETAKEKLEALNPYIKIEVHNTKITSENALELLQNYDVIADGSDNFPTRYLINDACVLLGKPNVYAAIYRFEGQVSVFNYRSPNGVLSPNYRDLFPTPPPPNLTPNCAEGGVIGVLPGIIGSLQANEVIKVIAQIGEPLTGRLFLFDALSFESTTLKFKRNKKNPLNGENPTITKLIDYDVFCGILSSKITPQVKEISVKEFQKAQNKSTNGFQLIDVRNPHEYEIVNLGGELIPLKSLEENIEKIATNKKVIFLCKTGRRSSEAILKLEKKYQFQNLYNLKGGILAWIDEINSSLPKY